MTFSKYKRLLLVLLIPLLIIGGIFSARTSPSRDFRFILCEPMSSDWENCRYVGNSVDSPLYTIAKERNPLWFYIISDKPTGMYIEGSGRILTETTILEFYPHANYSAEVASYRDRLIGKKAIITLGVNKSSPHSFLLNEKVYLYCNHLAYQTSTDTYESHCFGDGWGGLVNYKVSGMSKKMLSNLNDSISKIINEADKDLIIHWSIGIPLFVFVFLFMSLIVYLISKAYNYVKKG